MIDLTREMIAYGIITTIVLVGTPIFLHRYRRRQREKLRRRGIKTYGH